MSLRVRYWLMAILGFSLCLLGCWYPPTFAWLPGAFLIAGAYHKSTDLRPPESRRGCQGETWRQNSRARQSERPRRDQGCPR